jgi:hypothetical protein
MKMVRILGITIGSKEKDKAEEPKGCTHPVLQRGMRLNPAKQEMEIYCKKCGQAVEESR